MSKDGGWVKTGVLIGKGVGREGVGWGKIWGCMVREIGVGGGGGVGNVGRQGGVREGGKSRSLLKNLLTKELRYLIIIVIYCKALAGAPAVGGTSSGKICPVKPAILLPN